METRFVRVVHGAESHFVALYTGVSPVELSRLLKAAYRLKDHVVGLQHTESGVVVPMSLACTKPEVLAQGGFTLLLSDREIDWDKQAAALAPRRGQDSLVDMAAELRAKARQWAHEDSEPGAEDAGVGNSFSGGFENEYADKEGADQHDGQEDERGVATTAAVTTGSKLLEFTQHMSGSGLLSPAETAGVQQLVQEGSVVLYAAYEVALADKDLEYLAALIKDIAIKWQTKDGQEQLESQGQLLTMTYALASNGTISSTQSTYLQNLILVGSEVIGKIESDYRARGIVRDALTGLERIAHSATPYSTASAVAAASTAATAGSSSSSGARSRSRTPTGPRAAATTAAAATATGSDRDSGVSNAGEVLSRIVVELVHKGMLSLAEAELLVELIGDAAPIIVAAMEVYAEDGDEAELSDTLARTALYEMGRLSSSASRAPISTATTATSNGNNVRSTGKAPPKSAAAAAVQGRSPARGSAASATSPPRSSTSVTVSPRTASVSAAVAVAKSAAAAAQAAAAKYATARDDSAAADYSDGHSNYDDENGSEEGEGEYSAAVAAEEAAELTAAVQRIIQQCVDVLSQNARITASEAQCLLQPSAKGETVIYAGLELYESNGSVEELLDTLTVLAKQELHQLMTGGDGADDTTNSNNNNKSSKNSSKAAAAAAAAAAAVEAKRSGGANGAVDDDGDNDTDEQYEEEEMSDDVAQYELHSLLQALDESGRFEGDDTIYDNLTLLVQESDPRIMAAHDVYKSDQDVEDLVDSLLTIGHAAAEYDDYDDNNEDMYEDEEEEEDGVDDFDDADEQDNNLETDEVDMDFNDDDNEVDAEDIDYGDEHATAADIAAAEAAADRIDLQSFDDAADEVDTADGSDAVNGAVSGGQSELQQRASMLRRMYEADALDIHQAAALLQLLQGSNAAAGAAQVHAAFDVYEHSGDVEDLIDTLYVVAARCRADFDAENDDIDAAADDDEDDEEQGEEGMYPNKNGARNGTADSDNSSDNDDEDDAYDTAAAASGDSAFLETIQRMGLTDVETAALRLCVASADPMIRAALEVFRLNRDEEDLRDTLVRIARRTIEDISSGSGLESGGDSPRTQTDQQQQQQQQSASTVATAADNSGGTGDSSTRDEYDDVEVNEGVDLVSPDREQLFKMLLDGLQEQQLLSQTAVDSLLQQWRDRHAPLLQALEGYRVTNDLNQLITVLSGIDIAAAVEAAETAAAAAEETETAAAAGA